MCQSLKEQRESGYLSRLVLQQWKPPGTRKVMELPGSKQLRLAKGEGSSREASRVTVPC